MSGELRLVRMSLVLRCGDAQFLEKHSWLWVLVCCLELDQRKNGENASLR